MSCNSLEQDFCSCAIFDDPHRCFPLVSSLNSVRSIVHTSYICIAGGLVRKCLCENDVLTNVRAEQICLCGVRQLDLQHKKVKDELSVRCTPRSADKNVPQFFRRPGDTCKVTPLRLSFRWRHGGRARALTRVCIRVALHSYEAADWLLRLTIHHCSSFVDAVRNELFVRSPFAPFRIRLVLCLGQRNRRRGQAHNRVNKFLVIVCRSAVHSSRLRKLSEKGERLRTRHLSFVPSSSHDDPFMLISQPGRDTDCNVLVSCCARGPSSSQFISRSRSTFACLIM